MATEMRFTVLTLLACTLLFHVPGPHPQSNDLEAQRLAIARVRVGRKDAGVQTGAAIYVGNDQENGYFITAYHTINKDKGGPIDYVELQFFNSPQFIRAEIVDKFDEALDLGIVRTNIQRVPSQIKQLVAKEPTPATAIRIIGHPPAGHWSVWSGHIENENASEGDPRNFIFNRDASLTHGYSGGGIFDAGGNFLGMHLETNASYGKGLKSREILNLLQAFRVPTNNFGQGSQTTEDLSNTGPVLIKKIPASNAVTAVDREFDGKFDAYFTDQYFKLHIRKTDSVHPGALGPGEFRTALMFDLRDLPRNLSIRSARLSVIPFELSGEDNINVEIFVIGDYMTIGDYLPIGLDAFMSGSKVAGPIKFSGSKAFAAKMQAIDVTTVMKKVGGHPVIGFSIRQNGPFTNGIPFGTGFTIKSGQDPESRKSIDKSPHLTLEYQETVERVDYGLDSLECLTPNAQTELSDHRTGYVVDNEHHLLLNRDGKPLSIPDSTNLKELVDKRLIVIHSTSEVSRLRRSCFTHVFITRDGTVSQLVPFNYSVEHVSNQNWKGLSPVKDFTIAIELENVGELRHRGDTRYYERQQVISEGEVIRDIQGRGWHKFTNAQIHSLFAVICALRSAYPSITDMVGHEEIDKAGDPGLIFPMEELRTKLFPRDGMKKNNQ